MTLCAVSCECVSQMWGRTKAESIQEYVEEVTTD